MTTPMKRELKVLHVTEAFGAGVESSISELVARTSDLEHHLVRRVRVDAHTDGEEVEGCTSVVELPDRPIAALRAIRRAVRRIQPDVVHAHSSYAGLYVRLVVNARRTRVVYTPHGYGFLRTDIPRVQRLLIRWIERMLTWNTTALAACSVHEASLGTIGRHSMERHIVPNVLAIDEHLVDRHRLHRRIDVIVGCGRLQPIRDPDYFLRVVKAVREQYPAVEARWLGGRSGALADKLRASGIEVTGWLPRDTLLAEMAEASVYVHTSAWDGFPMAMLEAVSIGVPTVARRIPQLDECPSSVLFCSPLALAGEIVRLLESPMTAAEHDVLWKGFLAEHNPDVQRTRLLAAYGLIQPSRSSPVPEASASRPKPSTGKKILIIDYAGHPFQYDLAAELAGRGHEVVHSYSASTLTPRAGFEPVAGVSVEPVDLGRPFERYRPLLRLRDEISYGVRTVALARRHRPDRILASNVPVVSLALLWAWAFVSRTSWVLWLQDIQAGLVGMVTGSSGFIARSLGVLERFVIRRAPRIVAISEAFGTELNHLGVPPSRVTVIENWAPIAELPLRPRQNEWTRRHRLDDVFVFLYNGTLGMKHSPGLLIELAQEFADDDGVEVVVVGGGAGADWLSDQPEPRPLLLPFQPFEELPDVLASADVLVALLDQEAGAFSVPSKTLTYLCAGRPILAAVPQENAAAQVVADRARAGAVVPPSDPQAFRAAARALFAAHDDGRAGERARHYAVSAFDRRAIGDRFELALRTGEREEEHPGDE